MLRLSTKTRYALRTLLEMACQKEKDIFTLAELSLHQNISRKYLEQIFRLLKKNGIVTSHIGKQGGFSLPKDLKTITLLNIITALEGKIKLVDCQTNTNNCERTAFCPAKGIWQEINTTVEQLLASKNLLDLSKNEEIRQKCAYFFLHPKQHRRGKS